MFIVQTTLLKFCGSILPGKSPKPAKRRNHDCVSPDWKESYNTLLHPDGTVEVAEKRCKCCGERLYYNGYNEKSPVLDEGRGMIMLRVHRKRCPTCGEVSPVLNKLIAPGRHYHENYKRRARQHFMNGMNPQQICDAMAVDFQINFPRSTVRDWIQDMRKPLRKLMASAWLPSSGHWQHDETYLSIRGEEHYAFVTLDAVTGFALAVTHSERNTKRATIAHFRSIRRFSRQKIKSITADGTIKFGNMFKLRLFKDTARTQCLMHFKWNVSKKLKRLAGMKEGSRKPVPRAYKSFQKAFYDVLDSHDETQAYVALERLRDLVEKANKRFMTKFFRSIEGKLPAIIAWQKEPSIPKTNNKVENFHQQLQRHVSFEGRCRTEFAAQFIMDAITFKYNFRLFKTYIDELNAMRATFDRYKLEEPGDPGLHGGEAWFRYEMQRVMKGYDKYMAFWLDYVAIF